MTSPQPPEPNMGDPGQSNAEWLAMLASDDTAPFLLHAALDTTDPIPAWVAIGAQVAWQTRDLDSELFGLLSETSSVGASRSATAELRMLTFANATETLRIEVSIRHDASGPVVDGTVTGLGTIDMSTYQLSWQGFAIPLPDQESVELDRFGRFELLPESATRARIRLVVNHTDTEPQSLITPWFDIY